MNCYNRALRKMFDYINKMYIMSNAFWNAEFLVIMIEYFITRIFDYTFNYKNLIFS